MLPNEAKTVPTLLICPNKRLNTEVVPLVARAMPLAPIHNLTAWPARSQLVDLLRTFDAKLCFLEAAPGSPESGKTLELLQTVAPGMPVIAVLPADNPDLLLAFMRQGASEFLIAPLTTEQVDATLERVLRTFRHAPADPGKTIGVLPAKSGSGASTLACCLAWQLRGRAENRVLLADLDPLTGTLSFLLKLKSQHTFLDVLQRAAHLDPDLWKQMVSPVQKVDVLLAPESVASVVGDLPDPAAILDFARTQYKLLVLDLGSSAGGWNLTLARSCDDLLLVTSSDLPAIHAAQRTVAWFTQSGVSADRIHLVINRHVPGRGLALEHIPRAVGAEILACCPDDTEAVSRSLLEGKPIGANTKFGRSVAGVAAKLMPSEPAAVKKNNQGGRGLLSSLFSRS